mgnify:CR=1 FL=1
MHWFFASFSSRNLTVTPCPKFVLRPWLRFWLLGRHHKKKLKEFSVFLYVLFKLSLNLCVISSPLFLFLRDWSNDCLGECAARIGHTAAQKTRLPSGKMQKCGNTHKHSWHNSSQSPWCPQVVPSIILYWLICEDQNLSAWGRLDALVELSLAGQA